eukprot:3722560-Pyramimonas_sp.AAC.1
MHHPCALFFAVFAEGEPPRATEPSKRHPSSTVQRRVRQEADLADWTSCAHDQSWPWPMHDTTKPREQYACTPQPVCAVRLCVPAEDIQAKTNKLRTSKTYHPRRRVLHLTPSPNA